MRKTILISLITLTMSIFAQTDSSKVDDILLKLKKLEEQKVRDRSVNSMKVITGTNEPSPVTSSDDLKPEKKIVIVDPTILQAKIAFDTASFDIGSIEQGVVVKQKFTFTNTGTDDLELINVVPDCSCTSPEWSLGKIKPGQKGYVIATYDSKEDIGKFLKTVTVLHNSGEGWTFLELKGFVASKL